MDFEKWNNFTYRLMPVMEGEGNGGTGGTGSKDPGQDPNNSGQQTPPAGQGAAPPAIDYEKIANLVNGKQQVAEDTVLKNYFKQQGLSQDEAAQAIADFKAQKAKNTPDIAAMQQQTVAAQQEALTAKIEKEALLLSAELGVELKTMPYLIKMADMAEVVTEGKIDTEKLKGALGKVLEEVPGLKAAVDDGANGRGFRKVGADPASGGSAGADDEVLKQAFGL